MRYDIDSLENRDPVQLERVMRGLKPFLWRYFRPVIRGLDRIPEGPALYVGNHNGGPLTPDTFTFLIAIHERHGLAAVPYGLGHEVAINLPGVRDLLMPLGAVRASHENAHRLFAEGHKALVYPGGDIDSWRAYRKRDRIQFGSRRGYLRLALRENVPIVPLVSAGAHATFVVLHEGRWIARLIGADKWLRAKAWPITFSLPWGITIGPPPPYFPLRTRFFQEVLEPIRFERSGEDAARDEAYVEQCHERVLGEMQQALTRLAAERRAS